MRVDLFDFDLPTDLIAQHPIEPRDAARLLDLRAEECIDRVVSDLPTLLRADDILVVNDTKVIPARLIGRRGDAKVEVTLHKRVSPNCWHAFAKPAKKLRLGETFVVSEDLWAEVTEKREAGEVALTFNRTGDDLFAALHVHGLMPLPPYIKRDGDNTETVAADKSDYQTIFAAHEGAVAAPTASLHFTDRLIDALKAMGIRFETVTLHVGAGTFLPVKVDDTNDHVMHSEIGILSAETANRLTTAKAAGQRVIAVGTTALRLLESAARNGSGIAPFDGETDLFITPGFDFKAVDVLLTNFHLPRSTLFMLVSAFAGLDRMKAAYAHAAAARYRFYSYGDCCLLERAK